MSLYLTPAAIGYLTQLILSGLVCAYFMRRALQPESPIHTRLLTGFFFAFTLFVLSLFLETAVLPTQRLFVVFVENTLLGLALIFLLQFAYHYPVLPPALRFESRLALVICALYTLWEGLFAVFRFNQVEIGIVWYRHNWMDYWLAAIFLWVPVALLRQWAITHEKQARQTLRTFTVIFLLVAALNLFTILRSNYLLSVSLANMGISLGILAATFSFAVTYLNAQAGRSSIITQLVGVALTTVLAILGTVGWTITPSFLTYYQPELPNQRTLRFTPNAGGGYDISEVTHTFESDLGKNLHLLDTAERGSAIAASNFSFPFFKKTYDQIYVTQDGTITFGSEVHYREYQYRYSGKPLIMALLIDLVPEKSPGGVYAREEPGRLTITWDRLRAFRYPNDEYTFQAVLYTDGTFDLRYENLPQHFIYQPNDDPGALPWAIGALPAGLTSSIPFPFQTSQLPLTTSSDGLVQDYQHEFRTALHQILLPLAILVLIASACVLIGVPGLLYVGLVRPLNTLLTSIRHIEAGNYAQQVPMQRVDEIGFLARAFNDLAAQLNNLIGTLEARVAARTTDLSQVNAQLLTEIKERERVQANVLEQQRILATFEERERVGRDLHDGLGQVMGYINVQVQAVQSLLTNQKLEAAQINLADLALAARDAYHQIRGHILGLRSSELQDNTFFDVVRTYLAAFEKKYDISTTLLLPQNLPTTLFAPAEEEQVLRILQEALINAGKHAGTRQVEVIFSLVSDHVQLIISDNGKGFEPSPQRQDEGHFGLKIMRERAEQIGGALEVRSVVGQGTWVIATLPRYLPGMIENEIPGSHFVRILLADDHPLFLDGLRNLLLARGMTVIAGAHNGREALEKTRLMHPDVVVLDLNMPVMNGLETTRAIKAEFPDIKVVLLTVSEDENMLYEAIKSGAAGYLLKSLEANHFCQLLTGLMNGDVVLAPGMALRIIKEFRQRENTISPSASSASLADLSARQIEILRLASGGFTYKEIGGQLNLTEKTIKYHMGQIIDRLQMENRAQAIAYLRKQEADL